MRNFSRDLLESHRGRASSVTVKSGCGPDCAGLQLDVATSTAVVPGGSKKGTAFSAIFARVVLKHATGLVILRALGKEERQAVLSAFPYRFLRQQSEP